MNRLAQRKLIYLAVAVLCLLAAAMLSYGAALGSFVQILLVIESIYWLADRRVTAREI